MFELINYIRCVNAVTPPTSSYIKILLSFYNTAKQTWLSVAMVLLFAISGFSATAAEQGIAIDYLHGEGDLSGIRLAYRPYTQATSKCAFQNDWGASVQGASMTECRPPSELA